MTCQVKFRSYWYTISPLTRYARHARGTDMLDSNLGQGVWVEGDAVTDVGSRRRWKDKSAPLSLPVLSSPELTPPASLNSNPIQAQTQPTGHDHPHSRIQRRDSHL